MKAQEAYSLNRLAYLIGAVVCVSMILLGVIWPSLYTLVAVIVLPAVFIFLWAAFKPNKFNNMPRLKSYVFASLLLSVISLLFQTWWLLKA